MAKLTDFYRDRCAYWGRLENLLGAYDNGLVTDSAQADELYRLYRMASGDLAFMQTKTGNPELLDHLESLVAQAHFRLAPAEKEGLFGSVYQTLRHDFPAAVRREKKLLFLTLTVFLAGGILGAILALAHPDSLDTILAPFPHLLEQSPAQDAATRSTPDMSPTGYVDFSLRLFLHNLRISLLSFALGLTFGVGTLLVLFTNSILLGSIFAIYARDGALTFLLSWIGPHGSLEIPDIIISAMAGLMLARAQLSGGTRFWKAVNARKRDFLAILAGLAAMLAMAGAIEGGFSQVHSPSVTHIKLAVAGICFAGLVVWLFILPVKDRHAIRSRFSAFGVKDGIR